MTTPWEVLFEFSTVKAYSAATKFTAMDILYECPECSKQRVAVWPFPDTIMEFVDNCCNKKVVFMPEKGSEEE